MVHTNEYFEGRVKSLGFHEAQGRATIGVMEAGEYEFSSGSEETMTVIAGSMQVKLPGASDYRLYSPLSSFMVPANSRFTAMLKEECAYLCRYAN